MTATGDKSGLIIFGIIVVVVIFTAILAYAMTGSMGIEDRFSQAVGLPVGETGTADGNLFGFSLEGDHLSYLIVLGVLVVACFLLSRWYREKRE